MFHKQHWEDLRTKASNLAVRCILEVSGDTNVIFSKMGNQVLPVMPPENYDLQGFEATHVTSADGTQIGLWHKPAEDTEKPTYVAFHGRTGNWGYAEEKELPDEYTPEWQDNCYRHKWLKALADTGAGVIAVHTRGFGLSADPSIKTITEDALKQDMEAIDDYMQKKQIDPKKTIVTGESLGGALATIMSETMTKNGRPPAMLGLINTFSDITKAVFDTLQDYKVAKFRPFKWAQEDTLRKMMKDPLRTDNRVEAMPHDTQLYIAHNPSDIVVDQSHAKRLLAKTHGKPINVTFRALVGDYNQAYDRHHTRWNPAAIAQDMEATYRDSHTLCGGSHGPNR